MALVFLLLFWPCGFEQKAFVVQELRVANRPGFPNWRRLDAVPLQALSEP